MAAESLLGDECRYGEPVGVRKGMWEKGVAFLLRAEDKDDEDGYKDTLNAVQIGDWLS